MRPLEQRNAKLGLKCLDAPADRGYADVQGACGRREAERLGGNDEGFDGLKRWQSRDYLSIAES
jgi:hypothetical protein